ncbi:MAG: hypothetical protein IPF74_16760 [Rhodocyclaceae bacterium]|nr:hypothetical protein [Rhodocyclaceae bacterium]
MALSLYRGINTEEVRVVTEGMEYLGANAIRREVGKSAISAARAAWAPSHTQTIAGQALVPWPRHGCPVRSIPGIAPRQPGRLGPRSR